MVNQESFPQRSRRRHRHRSDHSKGGRAVLFLDRFEGFLILFLIVAAPWLFGCTEPWSIHLMNGASWVLGGCAIAMHYLDPRPKVETAAAERWFIRAFFAINIVLLVFCAISFVNARATFSIEARSFTYRDSVVTWLPTSYDRDRTFQFFLNSTAFFAVFWSIRSWLRRGRSHSQFSSEQASLNRRFKTLLWVFAVNGFLVALQGIFQRFSGTEKLLWFRPSYWGDPSACFGPFSYRGNGADFLNLVWPVTLGFWYVLAQRRDRRSLGIGDGPEMLLLPMFLVTVVATFVTLSRGGAIVAAANFAAIILVLLFTNISRFWKITVGVTLLAVVLVAIGLSGEMLLNRFKTIFADDLSGRVEIYQNARQIASDYPWFGTGPGTFLSVYHLYRETTGQSWAAFLHDDWLETRVTFGVIGLSLVCLQLALLFCWTISTRTQWISRVLTLTLGLSLLSALVHAKGDFPFQTYGIVFIFIVVSSFLASAKASSNSGPH